MIRETYEIRRRTLEDEIDEVVETGKIPSTVAEQLHAIRHVGNFSAHPIKSQNTGEILPVEPGEAEWILDAIAALFDVTYVQPIRLAERKASLNEKLREAGKPELA